MKVIIVRQYNDLSEDFVPIAVFEHTEDREQTIALTNKEARIDVLEVQMVEKGQE